MKSRDLLILAAGLPGVATPFLPFETGWWADGVTPLSLIADFSGSDTGDWYFLGVAIPMFLPIIATLWQARRLWPGVPRPSEQRSVLFLSTLALAITMATWVLFGVTWMLDGETGGFMVVAGLLPLIAGNAAVLVWNRRLRRPPNDIAECFLLGCYLCHAIFVLIVIIPDLDVGGWLVAWTCVVYTATIVLRILNRPVATAVRPLAASPTRKRDVSFTSGRRGSFLPSCKPTGSPASPGNCMYGGAQWTLERFAPHGCC